MCKDETVFTDFGSFVRDVNVFRKCEVQYDAMQSMAYYTTIELLANTDSLLFFLQIS